MIEQSDAELFEAVRGGDRRALERLIERHEATVFRFGVQMCGDVEDARDVLQETLLAAARTAPEFRGDSSVSSWLYAIARSFCIKKRRRRKDAPARVESLDALLDGEGASVPDERRAPDEALHDRQIGAALREAIAALEPGQREVLLLRDVEGLTAPEVAEVTGLRVEAVKSRLHRARLAVRARLAPLLEPREELPAAGDCPDVLALLSRHLEGDVPPDVCTTMEAHLARCPRCRVACDSLKRAVALCRATPAPPVPSELRASIRKVVDDLRATAQPDALTLAKRP
jgi:RNA polymerase sigma-70 factor (ECF subfamily)